MPAPLSTDATLGDIQTYVSQLEVERGFSDESVLQKCLLLGEEVGELFKAVRKTHAGINYSGGHDADVAGELADVLILVCAVANRLGVTLEEALRSKERLNELRRWT